MAVIKMNFLSKALGMQTNITVCLPTFSFADVMNGGKGFYVPNMKYQVLWLLHGGTGDDSDYVYFSNIVRYADDNKIAVIMPADYNMNYLDFEQGAKYRTYIAEELPLVCRTLFPISDKREDNFIGGLSMGSCGAQKIAIRYPENYAAVLGMSSSIFFAGEEKMPEIDLPMPPHKEGENLENMEIARKNVQEGKLLPKFFMTWGDKDFVRNSHKESSEFLRNLGYDVFEEEVPGYGHEWDFWNMTLRKALKEWLPMRHSIIYPERRGE